MEEFLCKSGNLASSYMCCILVYIFSKDGVRGFPGVLPLVPEAGFEKDHATRYL